MLQINDENISASHEYMSKSLQEIPGSSWKTLGFAQFNSLFSEIFQLNCLFGFTCAIMWTRLIGDLVFYKTEHEICMRYTCR